MLRPRQWHWQFHPLIHGRASHPFFSYFVALVDLVRSVLNVVGAAELSFLFDFVFSNFALLIVYRRRLNCILSLLHSVKLFPVLVLVSFFAVSFFAVSFFSVSLI